ncbi:MAG: glycosyltransferase [Pirellulales bacterium]
MTQQLLEQQDAPRSAATTVKVLHLINGEHYAGAEKVQDVLAARLGDFGYQVGFACLKPGRFPTARQAQHVPLVELPMQSRIDLKPLKRLARLIRDEQYQLVHSHTPRTVMVGGVAARLAGVPLVHHVHMQTQGELVHRMRGKLNAWVERRSLKRAARVIAVSDSLRRYIVNQGVPAERVVVAHNGVPSPPLFRDDQPPLSNWTIGCVALFRPRKGIEVLLDAVAGLRQRGLPARLRMVGRFETADYEREIRRQAARLDLEPYIDWIGFTTDVNAQLVQMDVLVLPSVLPEGLPMVVIEAMAAGVPVVGSDVDGVTDCIQDGHDGLLAAPGDAESLRSQLAQLMSGQLDWRAIRAAALLRHQRQFSDMAMARKVSRVYDEILYPESHFQLA